jgi:hypothetical protein
LTKKKSGNINTNLRAEMAIFEIESDIRAIEKNAALYDEKNFDTRIEAIDFIEFGIIDQIEALLQKATQPAQLISLKHRAEKVKSELEKININLFPKLRAKIRATGFTGNDFKNLVNEYVDFNLDHNEHQEEPGYDNLDLFVNGLFPFQTMPEQTKELEPEMVYYQKTPARIVFEMAEKSQFTKEDVFFDLGSGLGQMAILVNLLTGIKVKGVEMEPAFCDYARDCAKALNLSNVTFINADAREADYSDGTIFFMFTPFNGEMLQEVLEILRKESLLRKIKIITYGPCTTQVALQSWLLFEEPQDAGIYKPAIFISL